MGQGRTLDRRGGVLALIFPLAWGLLLLLSTAFLFALVGGTALPDKIAFFVFLGILFFQLSVPIHVLRYTPVAGVLLSVLAVLPARSRSSPGGASSSWASPAHVRCHKAGTQVRCHVLSLRTHDLETCFEKKNIPAHFERCALFFQVQGPFSIVRGKLESRKFFYFWEK